MGIPLFILFWYEYILAEDPQKIKSAKSFRKNGKAVHIRQLCHLILS